MNNIVFLLLAVVVAAVAMLIRNQFVYRARTAILDIEPIGVGLRLYMLLPSYNQMLYRPKFWALWTACDWLDWIKRRDA